MTFNESCKNPAKASISKNFKSNQNTDANKGEKRNYSVKGCACTPNLHFTIHFDTVPNC